MPIRSRRSSRRSSPVVCEAVEPRRYLAAVTVMGGNQADEIRMSVSGSTILVDVNGNTSSFPDFIYDGVVIQARGGGDDVFIDSTGDNAVTVDAGAGDALVDTVHLAGASGNLDAIGSRVTATNGGGLDRLVLHDESAAVPNAYAINGNAIDRAFFGGVTQSGYLNVELYAGGGDDAFDVLDTPADPSFLTLHGGDGDDLYEVKNTLSPVIVDGGDGLDVLNINSDFGAPAEAQITSPQDLDRVNAEPGGTLHIKGSAGIYLASRESNLDGAVLIDRGFVIERNLNGFGDLGFWRGRISNAAQGKDAGIRSPFADASATSDGLGYGLAEDVAPTQIGGFALEAGDVVVRYALKGDADLDGTVGFTDLVAVAQNYGAAGVRDWTQGDFNSSRTTAFEDLVALAQNYGMTSTLLVGSVGSSTKRPDTRAASAVLA